jgi:hypothetical protein
LNRISVGRSTNGGPGQSDSAQLFAVTLAASAAQANPTTDYQQKKRGH